MQIRAAVLKVHRWTGLTVGLMVAYLAVTGLMMVFRPQLQPMAERQLREVAACEKRLPLDTLVASAREFHPGVAVEQLQIARGGFGPTVVRFKDKEGVHMDPCTGVVLGQQNRWGGFFNFVEKLHRLLFLDNPDVSETIGGTTAICLAVLLVGGGLTVWWPASRHALKNAFKVRWKLTGQAFDVNLHRTVGVYVAIVLLSQSLSSLTFTFDWARRAVFAVTGSPPPAKKPAVPPGDAALLPSEVFLRRALEVDPKSSDIMLIYPRKATDAVEIYAIDSDAPHPNARTYVYLDPRDGRLLRYEPYAQTSDGNKVYRWLASLHMGYIGGVAGQVLLFIGILGIPMLAFTGIRSYFRCRARLKKS